MARPPKYEMRDADLRCEWCGHRFRQRIMHQTEETTDRGTLPSWTVTSYEGLKRPECGPQEVRVNRPWERPR